MSTLTPRELEILQLLTYGHTNRQIAAAIRVPTTAVIDHIADLYRQFGAHDRDSLIAMARPAPAREQPCPACGEPNPVGPHIHYCDICGAQLRP